MDRTKITVFPPANCSTLARSENADWNVGRLLDAVQEMGDLDNTLIFYIWGDNGASMEGTLTGSFNEMTFLNGILVDAEEQLKLIDQYGGIDALGGDRGSHFARCAGGNAHPRQTPLLVLQGDRHRRRPTRARRGPGPTARYPPWLRPGRRRQRANHPGRAMPVAGRHR